LQLLDLIGKSSKEQIKQSIVYLASIISSKFYLLTKQIIKLLFQVSFKLGSLEGQYTSNEIDKLLET